MISTHGILDSQTPESALQTPLVLAMLFAASDHVVVFNTTMLTEMTEQQLVEAIQTTGGPLFVFFYTPLCGTCKLAHRMLTIALAALPNFHHPVALCNINFMPQRAVEWEIRSVPCLTIVEAGEVVQQVYAFGSVEDVYETLKKFA